MHRDAVARNGKMADLLFMTPQNADFHFGAFVSPQFFHDLIGVDLHPCDNAVFDLDDAVAGKNADGFRRPARERADDPDRIVEDHKLDPDPFEIAVELLAHFL